MDEMQMSVLDVSKSILNVHSLALVSKGLLTVWNSRCKVQNRNVNVRQ